MRFSITLISLFIISNLAFGSSVVIDVKTQSDFDNMMESISKVITDGSEKVDVMLAPVTFYYSESHLDFGKIKDPKVAVKITGNGTTIISKGKKATVKDGCIEGYDYSSTIVDLKTNDIIDPWTEMRYADEKIEILDLGSKLCRLKCCGLMEGRYHPIKDSYILITAWCRTYIYKIQKFEGPYIYFVADNLTYVSDFNSRKDYNVNFDYIYGNVRPRFKLCNVGNINDTGDLYLCENQTFLKDAWGQLQSLTLSGITFLGNKSISDDGNSESSMLIFYTTKNEFTEIVNCRFVGQMSRVVEINNTENVSVEGNYFTKNFKDGISSYKLSNNTRIVNNVFENNGCSLSSNRCISCFGENYYIAGNVFHNFGYCGISVGVPYGVRYGGGSNHRISKGIVEYNELSYSDDRMANVWKYSIMDSGAIYLWTQNDGAVIRYNYIHGYSGAMDNRGIFCDDGAAGMEIYGNIIVNTPNSYSIDSRLCMHIENVEAFKGGRVNVNNKIYGNFVDGVIKFQARPGNDNGCTKGSNFILTSNKEVLPKQIVSNVNIADEDYIVKYKGKSDDRIVIAREDYRTLQKLSWWNEVKGRFLAK